MSTDERLARIEEKLDALTRTADRLVTVDRYTAEHAALVDAIAAAHAKVDKADDDRKTTRRLILGSFLLPVLIYLLQSSQNAGAT